MKLVMTLLVRDEEDIIRENIEFHLAQGVDFIIATDNRSVDDTSKILKGYESKGVLHYIYEAHDNYNQHAWVTRMAKLAYTGFEADWVINNDADEFWWPVEGDLKRTFERVQAHVNLVNADRHNFVATGKPGTPFWSRMVYREKVSLNSMGKPLPPKVAHRGSESIKIHQGNHSVAGIDNPETVTGLIDILHFPIRSYRQIENKIAKGGAAYRRNKELSNTIGITWRKLYEELHREKNLKRYFAANSYDHARIREKIESGEIIEDRRLADYLKDTVRLNLS